MRRNLTAEAFIEDLLFAEGEVSAGYLASLLCPDVISRRGLSRALHRLMLGGRITKVKRGVYRIAQGDGVQVAGGGVEYLWLREEGTRSCSLLLPVAHPEFLWLREEGTLIIWGRGGRPRAGIALRRSDLPPEAREVLMRFAGG